MIAHGTRERKKILSHLMAELEINISAAVADTSARWAAASLATAVAELHTAVGARTAAGIPAVPESRSPAVEAGNMQLAAAGTRLAVVGNKSAAAATDLAGWDRTLAAAGTDLALADER